MSPTAYGGTSLSSWAKRARPRLPDNMRPFLHGRIPPPTVCSPRPFGRHLSTLGHYAWRVLPPSPCPPWLLHPGGCCHVGASSLLWSVSLLRDASPPGLCPITSGAYAPFLPEDGGIYPLSSPGFLLLTPLARRTDQAFRLEAHGTWWHGSRWWISFYFLVGTC